MVRLGNLLSSLVFVTGMTALSAAIAAEPASTTVESFAAEAGRVPGLPTEWLLPTSEFPAARALVLPLARASANGTPVYASPDNAWFETDFRALRKTFQAADDLEMKEKWFDTFGFDGATSSFTFPHPTLSYWDILPHPPVLKLADDLATHSVRYGAPHRPNSALLSREYQSRLDALTGSELSIGNEISLRADRAVYAELLAQVNGARHSILAANMFVGCDASVEPLFAALAAKIAVGVSVDFVLEHAFALKFGKCSKRLKEIGARVHFSNAMIRLKHRTAFHAKFWVFDDESALVFGMNLIDSEVDSTGVNHLYHDSGILIRGPLVRDLTLGFGGILAEIHPRHVRRIRSLLDEAEKKVAEERAAGLRGTSALPADSKTPAPQGMCRAVFQGPGNDLHRLTTLYSDLIANAAESVYISMIRLPGTWAGEGELVKGVLKQLLAKTRSHPEFTSDILTNNYIGSTDIHSANYSRKDFLTKIYRLFIGNEDNRVLVGKTRAMLRAEAAPNFKVWDYFQFTHQKTMMVDRTLSLIGTYNLDKLSAEESSEIMVLCHDDRFQAELERSSIFDLMNAIPVLRGAN